MRAPEDHLANAYADIRKINREMFLTGIGYRFKLDDNVLRELCSAAVKNGRVLQKPVHTKMLSYGSPSNAHYVLHALSSDLIVMNNAGVTARAIGKAINKDSLNGELCEKCRIELRGGVIVFKIESYRIRNGLFQGLVPTAQILDMILTGKVHRLCADVTLHVEIQRSSYT